MQESRRSGVPVWSAVAAAAAGLLADRSPVEVGIALVVVVLVAAAVLGRRPAPVAVAVRPPDGADAVETPPAVDVHALVRRMGASSEQAVQEGAALATASGDVAQRTRSVAEGVQSLRDAIDEISGAAQEATGIAATALSLSTQASTKVGHLREAGQEIDKVTYAIASITDQTRTLALNATIEAARAGELGRGFSVVAGQVKELASATARAAESIALQIRTVQDETVEAVEAIEEITATLEQVTTLQQGMTEAVERQTTATRQIAEDVEQASHGTSRIAELVERRADVLRQAYADQALEVALGVLANAGGLRLGSEEVRWRAVDQFSKLPLDVAVPVLLVGDRPVLRNDDPAVASVLVDDVLALVGGSVTLFQRLPRGDMLRVATTVRTPEGRRAVGTYQPVTRPDGSANPVVAELSAGRVFRGDALVLDRWFTTCYAPLLDERGQVLGAIYVGLPKA